MRRTWFLSGILALAFVANGSAISIADIQTTGASGLLNGQQVGCGINGAAVVGCIKFGDKIFTEMDVTNLADGSVFVTGGVADGTVFIRFNGAFTDAAASIGSSDYGLSYAVQSLLGNTIVGITQSYGGLLVTGTGDFHFTEDVDGTSFLGINNVAHSQVGCEFLGTIGVSCDGSDPDPEVLQSDDLIIAPPLAKVWVTKDILVEAFTGTIGASLVTQGFVQVPEPGQTALLLSGFLAIGLYLKRKRAQA